MHRCVLEHALDSKAKWLKCISSWSLWLICTKKILRDWLFLQVTSHNSRKLPTIFHNQSWFSWSKMKPTMVLTCFIRCACYGCWWSTLPGLWPTLFIHNNHTAQKLCDVIFGPPGCAFQCKPTKLLLCWSTLRVQYITNMRAAFLASMKHVLKQLLWGDCWKVSGTSPGV